ncbi:glycosyltransferase family 2 protein [Phenylobacterium sp.]|uniref:glycosyltransferase family 2 protein n=1 Tax=Phenylobacterium sp. TaxID=1871053 RepID=UPI002731D906|nr:glycosyltransferase family 2 protein [Phenylobacterium sp.]MDP1873572.1 glycosyltransferase family 2 protein [Phenylobacterium sp.]MDP3298856.1 glycosyltransferase family 2 protein [Phenylobacterium sp.]
MNEPSGEDKAPPALSVVIVAYNSGATLGRCVAALAAQTFGDFELLIIDNASPQQEAVPAAAGLPGTRVLEAGGNLGFAAGVNLGAREARGRWLVLLNPDAYPDPDWLAELAAASGRHPKVKSFTSRQVMAQDRGVLDGLGDVMSAPAIPYRGGYQTPDPGDTPEGEVFSPCGAAMMVDRDLFLRLGGLDESFFCYCEDVDFGYRLQLVDEPTLLVPSAVIAHEGSASSGGPRSEFAVFHGTRNRFWVLVKNTPALLLPLVLPLHLLAFAVVSLRPQNRPLLGITWRGFTAALAGLGPVWTSRRRTQAQRRAPALQIARAMTWNPKDLSGRRAVIRPLRPSRRGAP